MNGTIPPNIGRLKALRWLLLGNNKKLRGSIPEEIGFLRELRQLDFHNCSQISGEIPASIGRNLTKLVHLSFHNCKLLTGPLPESFGNLSGLEELDIYNCVGLTGNLPPSFASLSKLARLVLRSGQVCSLKEGEPLDAGNLYHNQAGYHTFSLMKTKEVSITYDPQEAEDRRQEQDEFRWRRIVLEGEKEPTVAEYIEQQMNERDADLWAKGFVEGKECSTSASGMSATPPYPRKAVRLDLDSTVSDLSVASEEGTQHTAPAPDHNEYGEFDQYEVVELAPPSENEELPAVFGS